MIRDNPPCVVELRRFGVWRAAVAAVAAAAIAAMAAWAGTAISHGDDDRVLIATVAAVLAAGSALLAASLIRVEAGTLACVDGAWTFTFVRRGIEHVEVGSPAVALDLGSFFLIAWTAAVASRRRARRWLPVQRRGLERDWHALRCALYSPPPAEPPPAAASGPLTE